MTTLSDAIARITGDSIIIHHFVHDDANTDIMTESGLIPSLAKTTAQVLAQSQAAAASAATAQAQVATAQQAATDAANGQAGATTQAANAAASAAAALTSEQNAYGYRQQAMTYANQAIDANAAAAASAQQAAAAMWITFGTGEFQYNLMRNGSVFGPSLRGPQGPKGDTGDRGASGTNGIDGHTIWSGAGAPSLALGSNGDWYLDPGNSLLYGPKSGASWGNMLSLRGVPGVQGLQGPAGPQGLASVLLGTLAQRPDPASVDSGAAYYATDNTRLYISTGATWNVRGAVVTATDCATANDGQTLAIITASSVRLSTDGGVTWSVITTPFAGYTLVQCALSASGQYLYVSAANDASTLFISSDYGATWSSVAVSSGSGTSTLYRGVATSASGQIVYLWAPSGHLYKSSNYGATWATAGTTTIAGSIVRCSDDGSVVGLVSYSGSGSAATVSISTDGGASFSGITIPAGSSYNTAYGLAMSSSGQRMAVCCTNNNYVFVSTNYGATWTQTSIRAGYWNRIAMDATGTSLIVTGHDGSISDRVLTSPDFGVTWYERNIARAWTCVALSPAGNRAIAGGTSLNAWVLDLSTPAWLQVGV